MLRDFHHIIKTIKKQQNPLFTSLTAEEAQVLRPFPLERANTIGQPGGGGIRIGNKKKEAQNQLF